MQKITNIILSMKKACLCFAILFSTNTHANPMFADNNWNSVGILVAQSTGHGDLGHLLWPWDWKIGPSTMLMLQYSQPTQILRLPARVNIHVLQNIAYNSADDTSFGAVGIAWDVVVFQKCGWYAGVGIGPYMRDSGDRYVESRLVFGERAFVGKNITDTVRAELFTIHFSNGDFTELNRGFNFLGLGINYSF